MPIVPPNYRLDDPFIPLSDIDKIDKDDFPPAAALIAAGRARVGTWLRFTGAGNTVDKPGAGHTYTAVAPTWSDYDSAGLSGHPDSFRLSLLTMLIGSHRGRTRFYMRGGTIPTTGALLSVQRAAQVAEVDVVNAAAGAVVCELNDGFLGATDDVTQQHAAFCLRGPANGYIEYYKY